MILIESESLWKGELLPHGALELWDNGHMAGGRAGVTEWSLSGVY